MLGFWKTLQEQNDKKKYLDYLSKYAIPETKQGKLAHLQNLQYIFTVKYTDEKELHIEAAEAIRSLIRGISVKKLSYLDEQCRSCSDYCSWIEKMNWKKDRLNRRDLSYLTEEQYASVLCAGSFHRNGYCRQACVEELKEWKSGLPYLMLRLNDWVLEVRHSAYEAVMYRISLCELLEVFYALPVLEKVKKSERREIDQISEIESEILQKIRTQISEYRLYEITKQEASVKNVIYRLISQNKICELSQLERLMSLEKSNFGKQLLIQTIFSQYECNEEQLLEYMKNPSSTVRYYAMVYYYERCRTAWDGLEKLLLDKNRRIREYAAYILKKNLCFDVLGFYKEQLHQGNVKLALPGIGENGTADDLELVKEYLQVNDEQLKKTALQAYGMLALEQGEKVYWEYLQDSSPLVYVQAYRLIAKFDIRYGAKTLYTLYQEKRKEPMAGYLLLLLIREPSWKRLPYLLMLCDDTDLSENERQQIFLAIEKRSMYGKVTQEEAQQIVGLLEEKKRFLPETVRESILWDLRYM